MSAVKTTQLPNKNSTGADIKLSMRAAREAQNGLSATLANVRATKDTINALIFVTSSWEWKKSRMVKSWGAFWGEEFPKLVPVMRPRTNAEDIQWMDVFPRPSAEYRGRTTQSILSATRVTWPPLSRKGEIASCHRVAMSRRVLNTVPWLTLSPIWLQSVSI